MAPWPHAAAPGARRRLPLLLLLLLPLLAGCLGASPGADGAALLAKARALAPALDTPEEALAAGYVPTLECAPGMGVHWVHPGLLDGTVDPDRPEALLFLPDTPDLLDPAGDLFLGIEYLVAVEGTPWNTTDPGPHVLGVPMKGPAGPHAPGQPWHKELHVFLAPGLESPPGFPNTLPGIACPPGTEPLPHGLAFTDCTEQAGGFVVPAASVQGLLPEGFAPQPIGAPGTAAVALVSFHCAALDGHVVEAGFQVPFHADDVREVVGFVQVLPPTEWASPEATFHAIPLGLLAHDDLAARVYDAWGVPGVSAGGVSTTLTPTPVARIGSVEGQGEAFAFRMDVAAATPSAQQAGVVRMFNVRDGAVVGAYEIAFGASRELRGEATVRFTDAGPFPVPAGPGLGLQQWSDDGSYGYALRPVRLPARAG